MNSDCHSSQTKVPVIHGVVGVMLGSLSTSSTLSIESYYEEMHYCSCYTNEEKKEKREV